MWEGFILIVAGAAIGLVLAAASTRFMTNQLFGVTATDPLTYIAVTSVLIVTALAACYLPARRAARVDPLVALGMNEPGPKRVRWSFRFSWCQPDCQPETGSTACPALHGQLPSGRSNSANHRAANADE